MPKASNEQKKCPYCIITEKGIKCKKTGKTCSRLTCPYENDDDNYIND